MNNDMPIILNFYCKEVVEKIINKYGIEPIEALRQFVTSETYKMLANEKLEMWDFSPRGIFDMWEAERITGNPRNSLYIRSD